MRWARNIGTPLEWRTADRCLLVALTCLTFTSTYALVGLYYFANTHVVDYVDLRAARLFFRFDLGLIAGWLCVALAALLLRRRAPESRALVHVTCQSYAVGFAVCSYFFGHFTSLYTGVVAVAGWAFGLTLFERRPVLLAASTFLGILATTTLAEQSGWIAYGPLLESAPYRAGRFSGWFLVTLGLVTTILLLAVFILIDFLVTSWHGREARLTALTEQLSRANEVISRYIAWPLADKIRAGDFEEDTPSRRRLTLVFSDIVDFSETADELEPEDLSRLLNDYLAEMTAIAERHGATVDKFVGDAVICFFGAPVATDDHDHALRAVRMAMEMSRRAGQLDAAWRRLGASRPLRIRVGVNTGIASIGSFGSERRMDYTAIGRQVNLAARLEASCDPGGVLISHSTYELVREAIPCAERGEIHVKGTHQPVRVYSPLPDAA
jgi:class 3 adenylate cyclase